MDYILSFFGLGSTTRSQLPSEHPGKDERRPEVVSCRGWRRPDPAIRLRVENDTVIRMLGYPEPEELPPTLSVTGAGFGNGGSPILHLRGTIPAYVDYVMGRDWRSRLRDDYEAPAFLSQTWKVILRQDEPVAEREHCLRMRRCGATGVRSEVDINIHGGSGSNRGPWPNYQQHFGWPATGGVWILRNVVDYGPLSEPPEDALEYAAEEQIQERFWTVKQALEQQSDMEGVCHVIEEAGGQFYQNIEDCFEVVHHSLLA